ncbi:hypothetical protein, partial [Vibrio anguillarum]|uniref:hypothetical protein n=1 Tax=Vibrio anguillarum TaxID=55601 RepID=UPI001F41269D
GSFFVMLNPLYVRTINICIYYLKSIIYKNNECLGKGLIHTFSTYFQTFSTPIFMMLSNKLPQKKKAKTLHNPKSSDRDFNGCPCTQYYLSLPQTKHTPLGLKI